MAKRKITPEEPSTEEKKETKKIVRLSQSDVPSMTLDKALNIASAIIENYAGKPATALQVAKALGVTPTSGPFRMLCGASIAYGLTKGGYNADEISVEPIARRILKPTSENDDEKARIEAFLKPRVISEFVQKYNGSAIPREDIAKNVLEDLGVPADRLNNVYETIIAQGESLGIIITLKNKKYFELENINNSVKKIETTDKKADFYADTIENEESLVEVNQPSIVNNTNDIDFNKQKKVFITHGKSTKFIDPIKKLLSFGELEPVISVEKTTISQPVPDKVMNDMRSCGAAIIHVEDELRLIDDKANEHIIINSNVLIEIGAAMALYGRRFILLVKDGYQASV